jgi:adenine-specific DNA-methyltransferase
MENLMEELKELLKEDIGFVDSEGNILKNRIVELALKLDENLIKLLLQSDRIKQHFFKDIDGVLVFDKEKFMKFIDNKEFLPDSYTAFKNKIGLANEEGKYLAKSKEVVLVWPYKDCVLEGGQEEPDEKRKEIFHNVILAPDEIDRLLEPKVFTNFKRIDKDGEHSLDGFRRDPEINRKRGLPEDTITENLIIKGNNLLVLHSLLKEFRGKVKLIYIDPPYNPRSEANTFLYNNSFNHSTWLTFMKNRLEIARELLRKDGLIFIDIDHNELFYLGVLADEIFGYDNRIGVLAVVHKYSGRYKEFFANAHENKLVYAKDRSNAVIKDFKMTDAEVAKKYPFKDKISRYRLMLLRRTGDGSLREDRPHLFFPIYYNPRLGEISVNPKKNFIKILPIDPEGIERRWRWSKEKIIKNWKTELVVKKINGNYQIFTKDRYVEGKGVKPKSFWFKPEYSGATGTKIIKELLGDKAFSYPKSVFLVKDAIEISTDKDDIILDFFAGSGTTAHAVLELNKQDGGNRQFILCEQLDYVNIVTVPRVQKVIQKQGGGEFIYMELMKLNEVFVEKIRDAETTEELLNIWEDMKHNGFLSYRVDPRLFDENIEDFKALSLDGQKKLILEMLDYNDLYVNYSEIDDAIYNVSKEVKRLNKEFYKG